MKFFERKMFKIFLRNFGTPFWYMLYNSMIIAHYGPTRQIYEILLQKTKSIGLWKLFDWFFIDISIISIYIFFDIYIITKIFFKEKCCLKFHSISRMFQHFWNILYMEISCAAYIYTIERSSFILLQNKIKQYNKACI